MDTALAGRVIPTALPAPAWGQERGGSWLGLEHPLISLSSTVSLAPGKGWNEMGFKIPSNPS